MGYVTNVWVHPDWRDLGVGSRLMEHIEAWAMQQGIEALFLWPSEHSLPFYERLGFSAENVIMELEVLNPYD